VPVIECRKHTHIGGQSTKDDADVEDLVRREEEVKFARGKSLWNPIRTNQDKGAGSKETLIENRLTIV